MCLPPPDLRPSRRATAWVAMPAWCLLLILLAGCKTASPTMDPTLTLRPSPWRQEPARSRAEVTDTNASAAVPTPAAPPAPVVPPAPAPPAEPPKLYSFTARELDIKDALALFARTHDLNIVPDPDVSGAVTVDFRNLSLEKSMEAILDAFGYYAEADRGLVRVRSQKTEMFTVDYIRLVRGGNGSSSANISSGSACGAGVAGAGSSSSGGGGGGGSGSEVANISINQSDSVKFWDELTEQLKPMLTASGMVAINRMAGQIMVTDRKQSLDRVGEYIRNVRKTLHRQVDLEARIYEVLLDDQFQLGIDWQNVTARIEDYYLSSGGLPVGIPSSSTIIKNPIGGGTPGKPALSLALTHQDAKVVLDALQTQGKVETVSQPRLRTLNNQSALIKVGQDKPFFRQSSTIITGTTPTTTSSTEIQTVTIGTVLSITPQIAEDGWITLDISPVITRLIATEEAPSSAGSGTTATAPVVDVKQASTVVRVKDNNTIILAGLIQNEKTKTLRKMPLLADIPLLGHVFTGKYTSERKSELVIFVTPTIVQ
jgi:MSHA biogenesis protein MshL